MPKKIDSGSQEEIRKRVVSDAQNRISYEKIAKKYDIHIKTIPKIIKSYNIRKTIRRKSGSGRPSSLTSTNKKAIATVAIKNRFFSAEDIKNKLNLTCSSRTITRYLNSINFHKRNPKKKIKLNHAQKLRRLNWAKEHEHFNFNRTIFCDECCI
jgi:transposase